MNHRCAVLASLTLAGCSSLSYQEPLSGDRARVRFATQTENVVVVRGYDDTDCSGKEQEWMRLRAAVLVTSTPKRMGMPLWRFHENGAKELYVDATRPFHGLIIGSGTEVRPPSMTTYSCGVPLSFQFKAGSDYEVEYFMERHACRVSISQIIGAPGAETLARLATFTHQTEGGGASCVDAFRKRRWY